MNWIDLSIFLILIFFGFEGMRRGFIGETLDFISFLLAFFISLTFFNFLGNFFKESFHVSRSLANVIGFIITWFITETIFVTLAHLLILRFKVLLKVNSQLKPFSVIPAVLRGLVFVSILLLVVGTFPFQPAIKKDVYDSVLGSAILSKTQSLEQPLKGVFGGITQDTLSFLTIKPKSDEKVELGFTLEEFKENDQLENQMIVLVNQERINAGLKILEFDPKLRIIGRKHSADMFKRGYFSHYSPEGDTVAERALSEGVIYLVVGENLAYAPNLALAHKGLMNSSGHRANILSPDYNKIGIGIMDGGVYGLMITQVFSN